MTLSSHSGRLTRSPPLEFLLPAAILLPRRRPTTQVSKHDFDMAVKNAQEALRAKTSSSQAMLQQASSAMRNAVTALSLSEQEVANLRQSVEELKQQQRDAFAMAKAARAPSRLVEFGAASVRGPGEKLVSYGHAGAMDALGLFGHKQTWLNMIDETEKFLRDAFAL